MANNWTKHAIVVRKRTVEETRDLTLLVIGKEIINLAFYYGALALPIFALDLVAFVLFWLFLEPDSRWQVDAKTTILFLFSAFALIRLESAFVGSLATQYLGLWLFRGGEKIDRLDVFAAWFYRLPQLLYFLVLTRIFRLRAFYLETILLERTPFLKTKGKISTGARVAAINRGIGGELFSDSITTNFFWLSGIVAGYFLLDNFGSLFITESTLWFPIYHLIVFPLFVFAAQLFFVVYNFLKYVNFRVEREGWDVDLAFKVERAKLNPDADLWTSESGERLARRALRTLTFDREFFGDVPESPAQKNGETSNETTTNETETRK